MWNRELRNEHLGPAVVHVNQFQDYRYIASLPSPVYSSSELKIVVVQIRAPIAKVCTCMYPALLSIDMF